MFLKPESVKKEEEESEEAVGDDDDDVMMMMMMILGTLIRFTAFFSTTDSVSLRCILIKQFFVCLKM